MPNDDFRRELNNAFDGISGSPSSNLSARVRSALVEAPERRGPAWLAGVAAVAIAALVVGALFVVGPLRGHQPTIPGGVGASPSAVASPTSTLPPFVCNAPATIAGSNPPLTAFVNAVRVGTHSGYDRITIQFSNGEPATVQVQAQGSATFTQGASGQTVQLQGSVGLLVIIEGADAHTQYAGATDFHVGPGILEARQVEDFEGTVQWGLGLQDGACFRVFFMTGPDRLVIDVQT